MADVLNGKVPASAFRDKIVLIGAAAFGMGDTPITPFRRRSRYMGDEVHPVFLTTCCTAANHTVPSWFEGSMKKWWTWHSSWYSGAGLKGLVWPLPAVDSYDHGGCRACRIQRVPVSELRALGTLVRRLRYLPTATLVISYVSASSFPVSLRRREKRRIRKTFSQYLSPSVIPRQSEERTRRGTSGPGARPKISQ